LTLIQTVTETPAQVLTDAKIQPISEVLYTADSMMKRAALSLICREPSPQSASLARHLLADPDPDVRALAAVAVSLLESRLSDSVKSALKQVETQPRDPACYSRLGRLYLESAGESVTDSINRRFYLTQARSAFKKAISLDPKRNGDQIELAETLMNLGDIAEASAAINKVLSKRTTDSRAYLLAIELAFRERRFDQVLSLAKQARETLPANDKALATIQWWLAKEYADENV
jgi:tetratricopeptide (TPR) repeat protein